MRCCNGISRLYANPIHEAQCACGLHLPVRPRCVSSQRTACSPVVPTISELFHRKPGPENRTRKSTIREVYFKLPYST